MVTSTYQIHPSVLASPQSLSCPLPLLAKLRQRRELHREVLYAWRVFPLLACRRFPATSALRGLTAVSNDLQPLLVNAPFDSVAGVTAAALREEVDFVVLVGDLLDPVSAGPFAIEFLREQFAQLAEREIPVYWTASQTDLNGDWLDALEWPANVHLFSNDQVERKPVLRGGTELAELLGRSSHERRTFRTSEFELTPSDLFRIAALPVALEVGSAAPAVGLLGARWQLGTNTAGGHWIRSPYGKHSGNSSERNGYSRLHAR